jgi:exonuclease VII large subunit
MDTKDGEIISRTSGVQVGERIETQLADGRIISLVEQIHPSDK